MLIISKEVSWTPPRHHTNINAVSLLPVCQMFMSSTWMCHVAVFCIFLCKAMWFTAHRYYSVGAGHSVALKQFSSSSCFQELMRKENYLLQKYIMLYKTYNYTDLMLHTNIKNMNGKFLHDMLVNWFYGGIRTLMFLWWTITVEHVLEGNLYRKTTCL